MIYSIQQDQSTCKCGESGKSGDVWWNPEKCACECIHKSKCSKNKYWSNYLCSCIYYLRLVQLMLVQVDAPQINIGVGDVCASHDGVLLEWLTGTIEFHLIKNQFVLVFKRSDDLIDYCLIYLNIK